MVIDKNYEWEDIFMLAEVFEQLWGKESSPMTAF